MHRKTVVALVGAIVMAVAASGAALAASSGPAVTVQIKSLTKTLLKPTTVHGEKGWITKGGTPHGASARAAAPPARSTRPRTASGPASTTRAVSGIFVTSILGVKPTGIRLLGALRQRQAREPRAPATIKLHAGQKLLFKIAK